MRLADVGEDFGYIQFYLVGKEGEDAPAAETDTTATDDDDDADGEQ